MTRNRILLSFGIISALIAFAVLNANIGDNVNEEGVSLFNSKPASDPSAVETLRGNQGFSPAVNGMAKGQNLPDLRPKVTVDNSASNILDNQEKTSISAENKRIETEMGIVAQEFNENLSNPDKRAELQTQQYKRSAEYKKYSIKLAKDQLAREKNK